MATTPSGSMSGNTPSANTDPITGAPGAHPVGTGVGALAGGMAAGAVAGSVAGPVGTVIGAVVGAVAGGMAGKAVAEQIDPTAEDAYWRDNHTSRPYFRAGSSYDDYGPAYRYGVESYRSRPSATFDEAEAGLAEGWAKAKGTSKLAWNDAKSASRDAWQRVHGAVGNAMGDSAVAGDPRRGGL